jgi:hypothetical protein
MCTVAHGRDPSLLGRSVPESAEHVAVAVAVNVAVDDNDNDNDNVDADDSLCVTSRGAPRGQVFPLCVTGRHRRAVDDDNRRKPGDSGAAPVERWPLARETFFG